MTDTPSPPLCEINHATREEEDACEERRLADLDAELDRRNRLLGEQEWRDQQEAADRPATVLDRTVTVGPIAVFFTNVNRAMNLRAHSHTGAVTVVYDTLGRHGYPSFADTNAALERYIHALTRAVFKDATNEDIADRLFAHLDGYRDPAWERWGGNYRLRAVHLDVIGVRDQIGHDTGTTRYTVARPYSPDGGAS